MLVHELESLHQAQRLVHAAPNGQVVHSNLAQHALVADNEQAAQRHARVGPVLDQHAVVARDALAQVGHEREGAAPQTALLARSVDPGEVREVRVDAAADQRGAERLKLLCAVAEGDDLGRAACVFG